MTAPYYQDESVTLYHGKCEDILPSLPDDSANLVLTDPPYGVGKADWDDEFQSWWMPEAARIAPILGLMPGTKNILRCPPAAGRLRYRWTLAAHTVDSTAVGPLGYANWIPCIVYSANTASEWCSTFAAWCAAQGISRRDLDRAAGTSDMGGWWASTLPHRSQIPSRGQWDKLRARFSPPVSFDIGVQAANRIYRRASDVQRIVMAHEPKADHPTPKPIGVMRWLVDRLSFQGDLIIDPFAGSGSTLVAARELGRSALGIEVRERYCEVAARRLSQGVLSEIAPVPVQLPEPLTLDLDLDEVS